MIQTPASGPDSSTGREGSCLWDIGDFHRLPSNQVLFAGSQHSESGVENSDISEAREVPCMGEVDLVGTGELRCLLLPEVCGPLSATAMCCRAGRQAGGGFSPREARYHLFF